MPLRIALLAAAAAAAVAAALAASHRKGLEQRALVDPLTGLYRPEFFSEDDLYPDARPCLAALREMGLRVGVAGNQTKAARMLGISRGTLVGRLEKYDLPRPLRPPIR